MHGSSSPKRAALIAACVGATVVAGAAPALAKTVPTSITGASIYASGSSLQKVAQIGAQNQSWAGLASIWHATPAKDMVWSKGANSFAITNDPTVTYTSTSSGGGLAVFGDQSSGSFLAGTLNPASDTGAGGKLDAFIGTDDPPTGAMLSSANTASGGVSEVTVPLFQAPVAVILSLPSGITLGSGAQLKLDNQLVQDIYNASIPAAAQIKGSGTKAAVQVAYPANTWGALLLDAGLKLVASSPSSSSFTDADVPALGTTATPPSAPSSPTGGFTSYVLQVRNGGSGTTYAFQGFLNESGDTNYGSYADTEQWPTTSSITLPTNDGTATADTGPIDHGIAEPAGANSGSGALVKNTLAVPGSIGYVNLADAALDATTQGVAGNAFTTKAQTSTYDGSASHDFVIAEIQNNYTGTNSNFSSTVTVGGTTYNVYSSTVVSASSPKPVFAAPGTVNTTNPSLITVAPNLYQGNVINASGLYSLATNTAAGVGLWNAPGGLGAGFTPTGTWANTLADDPNIDGHATSANKYPIAAATYDVAWANYDTPANGGSASLESAYGSAAAATQAGNSAIGYLQYLVSPTGGQAAIKAGQIGYAPLPVAVDSAAVTAWQSIEP